MACSLPYVSKHPATTVNTTSTRICHTYSDHELLQKGCTWRCDEPVMKFHNDRYWAANPITRHEIRLFLTVLTFISTQRQTFEMVRVKTFFYLESCRSFLPQYMPFCLVSLNLYNKVGECKLDWWPSDTNILFLLENNIKRKWERKCVLPIIVQYHPCVLV